LLRKLIHAATVVAIPLDVMSHELTIFLGLFLCIGYALAELARQLGVKLLVHGVIERCARPGERVMITPLYTLVCLTATLLLADRVTAYVAILTATLGDAIATLIGKGVGRIKIWSNKTLEGSLTLGLITFGSAALFVNIHLALSIAAVVMLVELFSGDFDNLTIPLAVILIRSLKLTI
jgi:dolichol kinase